MSGRGRRRHTVGHPAYSDRVTQAAEILLDLSLARSTLTRDPADRANPRALEAALADERTRILDLLGDRAPVISGPGKWHLDYRRGGPAGDGAPSSRGRTADAAAPIEVVLGRDHHGVRYVARLHPARPDQADTAAQQPGARSAASQDVDVRPPEVHWLGLREAGTELTDTDTGVFTSALALAHWHRRHPYCPVCGAATASAQAGWVRRCPTDGIEHHPRTDPAIIVAVTDADDRLLLAQGVGWAPRRMSLLAGFVEAGESFEAAVAREVVEEVGVELDQIRYRGNQPWPFPASLMVGFTARATAQTAADLRLQPEEIAAARWFSRAELTAAVATREVVLPSRISIARSLIEQWYGGAIAEPSPPEDFRR